jgi:hypothetical protein
MGEEGVDIGVGMASSRAFCTATSSVVYTQCGITRQSLFINIIKHGVLDCALGGIGFCEEDPCGERC